MLCALTATNLRCHESARLEGLTTLNLLLGDNGQGKTSLLEAAYLMARCRSFRTASPRELIRWEAQGFRVEGEFSDEEFQRLGIGWSGGKRSLQIDGILNATLSEFWGKWSAVVFQNRDLALVQEGAQARRQWADSLIASADPAYLPLIQKFSRLLAERNALLRQPTPNRAVWEALTESFIETGLRVTEMRRTFSEVLEPLVQSSLDHLTPHHEKMQMIYETSFVQEKIPDHDTWFERECRLGTTSTGPHRDDWLLLLDEKPLRSFGSEGQQRSVALAMRLAELLLLTQRRGKSPLILIDDVFHELDKNRIAAFWSLIPPGAQALLATTRIDFDLPDFPTRRWVIEPGKITLS